MNNKILNYHIRNKMRFGHEYSYSCMFGFYNEIMGWDEFIGEPTKSLKRYKNLLNDWASADGWLAKDGEGKRARFYKSHPPCPVMALIDVIRSKIKWK